MIIDTHGHYDDEQFDVDREMLLTNLKERGLKAIVTVGASMQTSENALALAHQYPAVYAAVGVHPDEVGELNDNAPAYVGARNSTLKWAEKYCITVIYYII